MLVGLLEGASSPVIAVGQKVIDLVPVGLKNWAIETFGTDDKTVLVATTLVIVFLAGIATANNVVALAACLFHAKTWFALAPKAMRIFRGEDLVPEKPIVIAQYLALAVVSLLVLIIVA